MRVEMIEINKTLDLLKAGGKHVTGTMAGRQLSKPTANDLR